MSNNFELKEFINSHVLKDYLAKDTYGLWEVKSYTYDGTNNYGVYEGYIDEIALSIVSTHIGADYYALTFKPVEIKKPVTINNHPVNTSCKINLPFVGASYSIDMEQKKQVYEYIFENRPVTIECDGEVIIRRTGTPEEEREYKRQAILSKLTKEEREILGFTD